MREPKSQRRPTAKSDKSSRLVVRVQPNASRNRLLGPTDVGWKITLTAPPVEGKANRACVDFLSEVLGVPRSSLRIVRGGTSRRKTIEVQGLSRRELDERLKAAARG